MGSHQRLDVPYGWLHERCGATCLHTSGDNHNEEAELLAGADAPYRIGGSSSSGRGMETSNAGSTYAARSESMLH